jgi:hypothetical protein
MMTNRSMLTSIKDADVLYAEYASRGVEFARGLADMPWRSRELL